MNPVVVPARDLHELYRQAERSFERSGCSSAAHDLYVQAYVEAIYAERQRRAQEGDR